jgi:hypothetical protein
MRQKVLIGTYQHAALVTALPSSPENGDQCVLTDSLTAPTYSWLLQYVSAKSTNKWQFIGGSPLVAEVATSQTSSSTSYAALATVGPSITVPVAGDYLVGIGAFFLNAVTGQVGRMSYDIGGTGAVDADAIYGADIASSPLGPGHLSRIQKKSLTAVALVSKYKTNTGTYTWADRWMHLTPVAVGG